MSNKKAGLALIITLNLLMVLHLLVLPAFADIPQELLKVVIVKVLDVLKDASFAGEENTAQRRAKIRSIIDERFDMQEMSSRALTTQWNKLGEPQKKEFAYLFGNLLENAYVEKIEKYTNEQVNYVNERVEGEYATVKTEIITKSGTKVPIDYRFIRKQSDWKVYDIVIEGVSLVNNYRTQFKSILSSKSYEELVEILRKKSLKSESTAEKS